MRIDVMEISTAYNENESNKYDKRRFLSPQGIAFHNRETDQLSKFLSYIPRGGSTLEVGCGTGRFCSFLSKQGYEVVGVDPSEHMIKLAFKKCKELSNVSFKVEEGAKLSSNDNTYDFVFSIRVTNKTESIDYALSLVREMIRVTKPGCHVLVEYLNSLRPRLTKDVLLSYTAIRKMLLKTNTPAKIVAHSGILIVSHRAFSKSPVTILPFVVLIDKILSKLFPCFTDRSYVLIRKNEQK